MNDILTTPKEMASIYLNLLIQSRDQPGTIKDSLLAQLRNNIADSLGADIEYVQNSFELVADVMRTKDTPHGSQ